LFQPKVNSDVSTILEKVDYEELSVWIETGSILEKIAVTYIV
jgi:hypothetical protein